MKNITISLPDKLVSDLDHLCVEENCTPSSYVTRALLTMIANRYEEA